MKNLEIAGGIPLFGEINIQGSKNAVLPVLAACLPGEGTCVIENCPAIRDVEDTLEILEQIGCQVRRDGTAVSVCTPKTVQCEINAHAAARIRSSILFLGALLGKMKKAVLPKPGGCAIGARPIDLHLEALQSLGVIFADRLDESEELLAACGTAMHGGRFRLRIPSVGATENLVLASVLTEGVTVIENAAREPEVEELCRFLRLRGADIVRKENGNLVITGVSTLQPVQYRMHADRIVAGTYLLAAAGTRGCIRIRNFPHGELNALLSVLQEMGGKIRVSKEMLTLDMPGRPRAVPYVETAPFPGFPTDLQSPLMAVCAMADGTSRIRETMFENRFRTVSELRRMGAEIEVDGDCAVIQGVGCLRGAPLLAPDLRGGAALVIAALQAKGRSSIGNLEYIGRGYEDICRDFCLLGGDLYEKSVEVHE